MSDRNAAAETNSTVSIQHNHVAYSTLPYVVQQWITKLSDWKKLQARGKFFV